MVGRIRRDSTDPISPSPETADAEQMQSTSPPMLSGIVTRHFSAISIDSGKFSSIRQDHITALTELFSSLSPELLNDLTEPQLETLEKLLAKGLSFESVEDLESFQQAENKAYIYLHQVQNLSSIKLGKEEAKAFVADILAVYTEGDFSEFQQEFDAFLTQAQKIQSMRPKTVPFQKSGLDVMQMNITMNHIPGEAFREILSSVIESTTCDNMQLLHETWEACSLEEDARTVQYLNPRRNATHLCLFREQHPAISLQGMADDKMIDSSTWETEIYFTHPETMETRLIRLPFPVGKKMTVKEAKTLISDLKQFISMSDKSFKAAYPRYPHLKKFRQFVEMGEEAFIQAQVDFHAAPGRPAGSFAREKKATRAFLKKPNLKTALAAITDRSIYRLKNGSLSLLPQEKLEGFEEMATISPDSLALLMTAYIRGGGRAPLGNAEATVELERQEKYVVMKTTIQEGDREITRTTYYPHTWDAETLFSSGLFERDLLLAKAAFLESK